MNNLTNIKTDIIGEINNKLNQLKKDIILLNTQYPDLMECPDKLPSYNRIFEGKYLHTNEPKYGDPTYWIYPEGVEEKIEDDKKYRVWYYSTDASDPADYTTWNHVKYIQYESQEKYELKKALMNLIEILTFGK